MSQSSLTLKHPQIELIILSTHPLPENNFPLVTCFVNTTTIHSLVQTQNMKTILESTYVSEN